MEVYIDDMLVKAVKVELHIIHLAEAFQVLKSYNMKLNPTKCAFEVPAEKFLGFIVNSRGIEANLAQMGYTWNTPLDSDSKPLITRPNMRWS